jgi:hypothetical protein
MTTFPGGFDRFPPRPPSEVEWEDLLLRMEIAPRALALAVEDAGARGAPLLPDLKAAVLSDEWLGGAIESLSQGRPVSTGGDFLLQLPNEHDLGKRYLGAFASRRARNFAMLQRRGISVWDWTADIDGAPVTMYQLASAVVHGDGERLARVRQAGRGG